MKISCIATSRVPSDTANSIQVMKVCQALAVLGHEVHLMVPGSKPTPWDSLAEQYGLSTRFDISWLPANPRWKHNDFAWKAVRCGLAMGTQLIYTWTGQSAVYGLLQRLPVVFELHDLPTGTLGPVWFRFFLLLPGQKRLAIITRALQAALEPIYGSLQKSAVVIAPNGFDPEQYERMPTSQQARAELGLPQATTVLCAGHLYAGRGVGLFLELAKRFPDVSFLWVGGRPEDVANYRARVKTEGISNVLFTGFVSQRRLPLYQAAADVLLMPYARSIAGSGGGNSADICSPMKMFDYMAAGRAILSSDLPVIHEVLNETSAVFVPAEDVDAWVVALERLLRDSDLRLSLGTQAKCVAPVYTWKARAERVLSGLSGSEVK